MNVEHMVAVITGGASGLGEATATSIVRKGGQVLLADRDKEKGEALASRLGSQAMFVAVDVTSEQEVRQMLDQALERFGHVNTLVNCAGVVIGEKVVGREQVHDLASFQKVLEVNVVGTFNMTRLVADIMQKNDPNDKGERGVIINTSSIAAFDGQIGQAAYSASKGAVASMTLPVSRELSKHGIRVMAIAPGLFETPMFEQLPESAREALGSQTPFPKRLGRASEFAQLVVSIAENVMLNGEVIRLDGAIRMQPR